MTKRLHYFKFDVDRFLGDNRIEMMSTAAVGAHVLLRCRAWRETPPATIPDNDRVLARWARMSPDEWLVVKEEVLSAWTRQTSGRWLEPDLRREYDEAVSKSRKARDSANARWKNRPNEPPDEGADATALRSHCDSNAIAYRSPSVSENTSSEAGSGGSKKARAPNGHLPPGQAAMSFYEIQTGFHALIERIRAAAPPSMMTAPKSARNAIAHALAHIGPRHGWDIEAAGEWLIQRITAFGGSDQARRLNYSLHKWLESESYDAPEEAWIEKRTDERKQATFETSRAEADRRRADRRARECDADRPDVDIPIEDA